jgi:uncharacterized protein
MANIAVRRRKTISDRYRKAAERFTAAVRERFGDQIRAVVLYGSVARGEARRDSDIDVLVIRNQAKLDHPIFEIGYDLDAENNYVTLTMPYFVDAQLFEHLSSIGAIFAANIIREGVILYDDGLFTKIRSSTFGAGSPVS